MNTSMPPETVSLQVLGKQYAIKCPAENLAALRACAALLNQKISEIKKKGKLFGTDQHIGFIAVAALNLAHELIEKRDKDKFELHSFEESIVTLTKKINETLEKTDKIP